MASTLSSITVSAQINADIVSSLLSGNVQHLIPTQKLAFGTSAGEVDLVYAANITLATGTPLVLDLDALTDPSGNAVNFGHLTHYLIENLSTVAGQKFTIGGGTNGIFASDDKPIEPNKGFGLYANPNPGVLVDATHKYFQITVAAGTSVAGRITLLGRST